MKYIHENLKNEMKVGDYVVIGISIGKILKINGKKVWCLIQIQDEEVWYSYNSIDFYSSDEDVCKAYLSAKKYNI